MAELNRMIEECAELHVYYSRQKKGRPWGSGIAALANSIRARALNDAKMAILAEQKA